MILNKTLSSIIKDEEIIIVCVAENACTIDKGLSELGYKIVGYADNSKQKQGKKYNGKLIMSVHDAVNLFSDAQFLISIEQYHDVIKSQLLAVGVSKDKIICMDLYSILEIKHLFPGKWLCEDKYYIHHSPEERGRTLILNRAINYVRSKMFQLAFRKFDMKRKKYYSSICAIFKDEAPYLKEWITYYRAIGLEHLYLYNNNSSDFYLEILEPFIKDEYITLVDWPFEQGQISAYRDCIEKNRAEVNWIGLIDLDEFVTPMVFDNINEELKRYEKYASVWIPELIYGSSGIFERDIEKGVLETFTYSWPKHSNVGKCFFNTDYEIDENKMKYFYHYIWAKRDGKSFPSVNVFGQVCFPDYFRSKKQSFPLDLKHYVIKSKMEYQKKMNGTDATYSQNQHTENAFFFHDIRSNTENNSMVHFKERLKK